MQVYRIAAGSRIGGLALDTSPALDPLPHQVRVRIRAVSLNYRDLMIARGEYLATAADPVIPCSDGAGEVISIGEAVTRFRPGDRVVTSFFPEWIDGAPTPEATAGALGAVADGVLAEEVALHEDALVRAPAHLDFAEASTLTCAGVTAWNALFVSGRAKPGDCVLLLGTGGVSVWALQLAKAAGLRAIVTSSSDAKLERVRALGADHLINYRTSPEWQDEVLRLTGGRGVDHVLEVGGQDTLARSLAATRMGGRVAVIGGVSGFGAGGLQPIALIGGAKRLDGIFVGSRTMLEDLARFVESAGVRPVVDEMFPFARAREAYERLESGRHFGKLVVSVGD